VVAAALNLLANEEDDDEEAAEGLAELARIFIIALALFGDGDKEIGGPVAGLIRNLLAKSEFVVDVVVANSMFTC
jgi:hypothetical protein